MSLINTHQPEIGGLSHTESDALISILQHRLSSLIDLHLTLKHVHWNVVGPNFIGVHEMLDPQTATVRGFADVLAERIATLGGSPSGTSAGITKNRDWDDYDLGRDTVQAHLAALDLVYTGVVKSHRDAIAEAGMIDPITEDVLIGQTRELEQFQWFLRAHLEDRSGELAHAGSHTELGAADAAR
ncbi:MULTISPECIES: DNA starvation/stationary phase protection protein Dps [Gordonia]|uniref:DNA-binding protein Dps n=2 Tax=Gordonia TaxID=2053 RepID=L7LMZ3_9ACTN|nr:MULTISPECIES: DNA starvation/stationary phase protection protein Dps [Gordonia]AUH67643.1 DNA starvation/stationary phase protection protein Dps [Gordonia sp. YC-JH1]MBY4568757.1 DNA starvation/stationary phase protection protein [Gordonia sihwensis]GAC61457.1 DNA-binding protein Dps [Gordonia sihwensis NBRC 108236]